MKSHAKESIQNFIETPSNSTTWFLDTCVWSEIISSQSSMQQFPALFEKNNYLAGLTIYTLFELSRVTALASKLDELFYTMRHFIWLAIPYNELMQTEQNIYPNKPKMKWMPLSTIIENNLVINNLLTRLSNNQIFKKSLADHIEFGDKKFMQLGDFRENFPRSENGKYIPEQAHDFALINNIQYFLKYDPNFMKRVGVRNFLPEHIPSQFARALFLFYKYYIQEHSPQRSDFLDYAHISYLPYVDTYVTEKNASNVLRHIKSTSQFLTQVNVLSLTEFMEILI